MLLDYEQELTLKGGHLIDFAAGSEYGSKPYDLKSAHDPAVAEPMHVLFQVVDEDVNNLTSLAIALVNDDDGAGGSEIVLVTKTVLLADLTQAKGVQRVGIVPPGLATKQYLTAKLTVAGTTPTTGKVKVWFQKGSDVTPANAAGTI